ncbi:serpin family protein [Halanaerobacter jeridensis]|uniref:Serpin B n=1 Tax=Halanaerobacter jeridensis TaxID=706427 RepID=A0A938XW81_9FIRM|nr:serpin B [Halanaerobacter jeridensis]
MKKIIVIITLILVLVVSFSGCLNSKEEFASAPVKLDKEVQNKLIKENYQFSYQLFKTISNNDREKNVAISPLSVSTVLTMIYNGANGETKTALAETLGLQGLTLAEVNNYYEKLQAQFSKPNQKVELKFANSIWTDDNLELKEEFMDNMDKYYQGQAFQTDFSKSSAVAEVNNWIAEETQGKIPDMIDSLTGVKMMLINALYFKADWQTQFPKSNTRQELFTTGSGQEKQVAMMGQQNKFNYYQDKNLKLLELPYSNQRLAMYIVLANKEIKFNSWLKDITPQQLQDKMNKLSAEEVKVALPKFKLSYGSKELNGVLTKMGLGILFNGGDLSKIAPQVTLGAIEHKTVLEVNEEGSEAAGATDAKMPTARPPGAIKEFNANHPFLFIIKDKKTANILFMGQIVNPKL